MDAIRTRDAMNKDAIDREIQSLLAATPSPAFVARVRAQIATEPAPSSWTVWRFAAATGLAALVVLAIVVARPRTTAGPSVQPIAIGRTAPGAASAPPAQEAPARSSSVPVVLAKAQRNSRGAHVPAAAAEVLIDAREARALRDLILEARDGRMALRPQNTATPTATAIDPPAVSEIDIPLINIDPLEPPAGPEGARQ